MQKNIKRTKEEKKANKKLRNNMKNLNDENLQKGYSQGSGELFFKNLDKVKHYDTSLFNIDAPRDDRQKLINPSLKPPPVPARNFSRLAGLRTAGVSTFDTDQILKVLGWHEQRILEYKQTQTTLYSVVKSMANDISVLKNVLKQVIKERDYIDFSTLKHNDNMIRKIQSTWRFYNFRRCCFAIKVQRWFRYKKNVRDVAAEVKDVINNIMSVKAEARQISSFLATLNSKKALPLDKLRKIKAKIERKHNRLFSL